MQRPAGPTPGWKRMISRTLNIKYRPTKASARANSTGESRNAALRIIIFIYDRRARVYVYVCDNSIMPFRNVYLARRKLTFILDFANPA